MQQQEYFDKFCVDAHSLELDTLIQIREVVVSMIETRKDEMVERIHARRAELKNAAEELERQAAEFGITFAPPKARNKPKYRNPDDPTQTWTGRGQQPKWVRNLIANGIEIASCLIDTSVTA